MKRIIVTGAGGSAGTNFIRSLRVSPEKFYIVGVDISKYHIKLSKADKNYLVPSCSSPAYLFALNDIIDKEKIEFLHCQPDTEVLVVSENRDKIKCNTFLPAHYTIKLAQDKMPLIWKLEKAKVPVPYTYIIYNEETFKGIFDGQRLWLRARRGAGSLAALPVTEYEQAYNWIEYWKTRGLGFEDFMISEYLPGKEYAFQSLWKDGNLITSATRERIEYLFASRMPSGQSSTPTVAKSVHNKDVNTIATNAIKALDHFADGIFCVDLKENRDGVPCVMEINAGRFFTTSLFFSVAGANMPYWYVKLGYGERVVGLPQYNAVPPDLYWIRQIDMGEDIFDGKSIGDSPN